MHSMMYAIYCPCMTPFVSAWKRWGARPGWPKNAGNSPTRCCISVIRKNSFAAYGSNALSSQGLAILRELAIWRDREARQRDRPPGSVLHDELLVEIARKAPRTLNDLQRLRGFPARELERSGSTLLGLVAQGLAVPENARPQPLHGRGPTPAEELIVKVLEACLKALCAREKLSSAFIASRTDLETLVRRYRQGRLATEGSPILEGWRGALVGQELLAVLSGRVSIQLHPQTGRVEFIPRTP